MVKSMSSLDVRGVVAQLQDSIGKRLKRLKYVRDRIYELQIGKKWLIIDLHFGAFLGPSYNWQEDGWALNVTRLIKNQRINNIQQLGLDRIIKISAGRTELILELFGEGNIIITQDKEIKEVRNPREWKGRKLYPKHEYKPPQNLTEFPETKKEFQKYSPTRLVGKRYASQCNTWKDFHKLIKKANQATGTIKDKDFHIGGEKPISRAIYEFYTQKMSKVWKDEKLERLKKTIQKQKNRIKEYHKKAKKYRKKAEYMYKNLGKIHKILQKLKKNKTPEKVSIKKRSRYMVALEM